MPDGLQLDPRIGQVYRKAKAGPPSVLEFAELVRFEPDHWEEWQRDFLLCDDDQIALTCHRGAGKSAATSVKALFKIVSRPGFSVLAVSRADDAAMQLTDYVHRRYRMLPSPPKTVKSTDHKLALENGSSFTSIASGDNAPRSYHVNMMIEDEAAFVAHAVYMAARPTVRAKRGSYIILSTPKGKAGHFYEIVCNQTGWTKFFVPWTKTKRFTPEDIEKIQRERVEMGEDWFRQEYECEFLQTSGQMIAESQIEAARGDVQMDDNSDVVW
jgi:hypothetical protein